MRNLAFGAPRNDSFYREEISLLEKLQEDVAWLHMEDLVCVHVCEWLNRDRMGWMGLVGARLTKINEIYMVSDATYYIRLRFR